MLLLGSLVISKSMQLDDFLHKIQASLTAFTFLAVVLFSVHYTPPKQPPKPLVVLQQHQLHIDTSNEYHYLRRFFMPLAAPHIGEWRYEHHEALQSFAHYLIENPVGVTTQRNKIYVVALGAFSGEEQLLFQHTLQYLQAYFGIPVLQLPALPLALLPTTACREGYQQPQYLSTFILDKVLVPRLPSDAASFIALTNVDLYPASNWNFVFGQAHLQQRVGVWSLCRLKAYDKQGLLVWQKSLKRVIDVAVHELGHSFALKHCVQYACVMNGSNTLAESDEQPSLPCVECLAKIAHATQVATPKRLQALQYFFEQQSMVSVAKQCKDLRQAIHQHQFIYQLHSRLQYINR